MLKISNSNIAVWFPTVRTGTGTDVFTERLVEGLNKSGIRAEITWLPLRAEYAPWTVAVPKPPEWATIAHVNTWLHSRFLPKHIRVIATLHHSIHDPALRPYKGWLRAAYHRWWIAPNERRILKRADKVTAVSQFVADMAKRTLCNVPMQVIYNGVDTDFYCPCPSVKKELKPFKLLFVGSWIARKGVDLLPLIMSELGGDFELHYTGGSASEKDKVNMPSNMHDIGRLNSDEEVVKAMRNADVLLFPSRSEGHPLVAIEAMACGLPVVSVYGTSLAEVISNGETGVLCILDDVMEFVTSVKRLNSDQLYLSAIIKSARSSVIEQFSESSMLAKYAQLYKTLSKREL